jgi:AcrR family transcriptional regulator
MPAGHTQIERRGKTIPPQVIGRPRDERIDAAVVAEVLRSLKSGGYQAVTMEGIASTVRRPRSSLYRRWPSKRHLVAYAVVNELGKNPAADTGSVAGDLAAAVGTLLRAFRGPLGRSLAGIVADMAQDAALAVLIREQVLAPRRRSMREALERGLARGEVRHDLDLDLVLDMLTGPFYFRTLFGHASIGHATVRRVVEYVMRIVTPA